MAQIAAAATDGATFDAPRACGPPPAEPGAGGLHLRRRQLRRLRSLRNADCRLQFSRVGLLYHGATRLVSHTLAGLAHVLGGHVLHVRAVAAHGLLLSSLSSEGAWLCVLQHLQRGGDRLCANADCKLAFEVSGVVQPREGSGRGGEPPPRRRRRRRRRRARRTATRTTRRRRRRRGRRGSRSSGGARRSRRRRAPRRRRCRAGPASRPAPSPRRGGRRRCCCAS